MTTYTITTDVNIDELTAKAGADTYNINGGSITIDQDSRYGLNQTTSTVLGNITISSSLGGNVIVDARHVRLIPFENGSGSVPAAGTVISQGSVTSKLIGVWSSLTAAPIAAGSSMPSTGFIKVKQVSQILGYTAGALTGITADSTGSDTSGWIELVAQDLLTFTIPRLGSFEAYGDWFYLGETNGSAGQTLQIPNSGLSIWLSGVFIEDSPGSDNYLFYPNCLPSVVVQSNDSVIGRSVAINNRGLVYIGHNSSVVSGYLPPSGCKVRIPNVFMQCSASGGATVNKIPHSTLTSRFEFNVSSGGSIKLDTVSSAWYFNCSYVYNFWTERTVFLDSVILNSAVNRIHWVDSHVAGKADVAGGGYALNVSYSNAGIDLLNATFSKGNSNFCINAIGANQNIRNVICRLENGAYAASIANFGSSDNYIENISVINGYVSVIGINITIKDVRFASTVLAVGTDGASLMPGSVVITSSYSYNCVVDGITLLADGFHPYAAVSGSFVSNSNYPDKIFTKNIGSRASPIDLGSYTKKVTCVAYGGASSQVYPYYLEYRNIYVNGVTAVGGANQNISGSLFANVYCGYSTPLGSIYGQNTEYRSVAFNGTYTVTSSAFGSHYLSGFTSDTEGKLILFMNEPSTTSIQYINSDNAKFTGGGYLTLPKAGNYCEWEWSYTILGFTAFAEALPTITNATASNFKIEISVDTGSGYSNYIEMIYGDELLAFNPLSPSDGFKIKVKLTALTNNTNTVKDIQIAMVTTLDDQHILYPEESANFELTGLVFGSDVTIKLAGTETILTNREDVSSTSLVYTYYSTDLYVDVDIYKPGYIPYTTIRNYHLTGSNASIPIVQQPDPSYLE